MTLGLLLRSLGLLFTLACRLNPRIRAQIPRPTIIEIRIDNGARHRFVFADRSVSYLSYPAETPADVALIFTGTRQALRVLLSSALVPRLTAGLKRGTIRVEGNALILLWFEGLVHQIMPISRPPALAATPPGGYISHDACESVSRRITREGIADTLDPTLTEQRVARSKLLMMRGSNGERLPLF